MGKYDIEQFLKKNRPKKYSTNAIGKEFNISRNKASTVLLSMYKSSQSYGNNKIQRERFIKRCVIEDYNGKRFMQKYNKFKYWHE